MKHLKLLSKIALSFKDINNFDKDMRNVLNDIGNSMDLNEIYIVLYDNNEVIWNEYEWYSTGIANNIENIEKIELRDINSLNNIFKNHEYISLDNKIDLSQKFINLLKLNEAKSLVMYPVIMNNEINGFIGFSECANQRKWTEELGLLNIISGIISTAYEKLSLKEELVSKESNFDQFIEKIDDMVIISDLDGQVIYCNESLTNKLGYSLSELKNMNVLELHPENIREEAYDILNEILKGEKECCPLEIQGKLGEIYSVETRTWFGKWDRKDCIYSISKDITKQNESLQLVSKVFENNPLPMVISSKYEREITKINPAFSQKMGYSKEVIGKNIMGFNMFPDLKKIELVSKRLRKQRKIENEEFIVRHKDGKTLTVLFSLEEIINQGKESILAVMVDITERVELNKRLEIKYQKLINVIEGANLSTWEWNIQTDNLEVNEQWAKKIGHSLKELKPISNNTWVAHLHPEDLQKSDDLIIKHLNGETDYYESEVRMKHKNGKWIWVHHRGKIIEKDNFGNPVKMFGIYTDITSKKEATEAIKENERRFFLALDKTKAGLWDFDISKDELFLSSMWKRILGYKDNEIENSFESWKKLWHPEDKDIIKKSIEDYSNGKSNEYEYIYRLKHKDGSWRWILSRGGVLKNDEEVPYRWIGTNIDITKEHEQSLELERIFLVNLDLLCIVDTKGYFLKVNQAWHDILGYEEDDINGRKFIDFVHEDDVLNTIDNLKPLINYEKVDGYINRYRHKNGEYLDIEWRANPYEGLIYASARDVTDRVKYENKILELSNRDALTNIYNRRYVYDKAKEMIKNYKKTGKIFSVSIIDVDYFKKINDSYGHQTGDYILKEFTKIINNNLRSFDILGRYGGEEFIVILDDTNIEQSHIVIERILKIVREKVFICNGEYIEFTFSAGISNFEELAEKDITIDKLVEIADRKMYEAKNKGRDRIVYDA